MGIADNAGSIPSEEKVLKSESMASEKDQNYSHHEVTGLETFSDEAALPGAEVPVSSDRMLFLLCSGSWLTNGLNRQMTFRRFMGFVAMAFLWTGSQIPVYLFGELTTISDLSTPFFSSSAIKDDVSLSTS